MRYENEKCPVCGETFNENDEVAVCPECATPHHKACYLKLGHCVNEERHGEDFVWEKTAQEHTCEQQKDENAAPSAGDTVKCPVCSAENKKHALICSQCGAIINPEINQQFQPPEVSTLYIDGMPVNNDDFIDDDNTVTVREASCFIQKSVPSYIKTFLDAKCNGRNPKFNISALLLGPYWFFFRKIYKVGFAFAGVIFAIECFMMTLFVKTYDTFFSFITPYANDYVQGTLGEDVLNEASEIFAVCTQSHSTEIVFMLLLFLLIIAVNVVAGVLANKFYLNHIKKNVLKIRSVIRDAKSYYTYLFAKGGTTVLNVFLIGMAIYYFTELVFSYALM